MPKIKEKHIENLAKGKKSGAQIGSRSTPHHLYKYEEVKFEMAIKKRFLTIDSKDRINLENLWEKYCQAKNWPLIIVIKELETGTLFLNKKIVQKGDLKSIKKEARSLASAS